ncbi:hypothetical protein ACFYNO_30505 [Kitasatospora sp. NPDC006697]|uniref:hypothetical protein n=1 Tax=Kitasatospora sp. NPDC006697 TaxID=3364020 RepID=UPI00369B8716
MSTAAIPGAPLPVRTPGSRARGRHRRPERPEVPTGAPALVLAVPGPATPESVAVVEELISMVRGEQPGIEVLAGWLTGAEPDQQQDQQQDQDRQDGRGPLPVPTVAQLLHAAAEAGVPVPVLLPLLAGPHPALAELHHLAEQAGATVTDVLGPHPLLAEAVHVRLSEAGLARADRARLFAIATAADGVVLTTAGGEEGAAAAGITGVLLAARLAVPVVAAALDVPGSVAGAVDHLRATGSQRPALAPLVLGPEVDAELLLTASEETGCPSAAPVGAYPTVAQLVGSAYLSVLPPLLAAAEEAAQAAAEAAQAADPAEQAREAAEAALEG